MKNIVLITFVLIILVNGCSKENNPVSVLSENYITGQIFMVGNSSSSGLALITMNKGIQEEYMLQFNNWDAENIAYNNQGKYATITYSATFTNESGMKVLLVDKVVILANQ